MKRNVCQSKYDPLVDEVDLIEANPQYAHIRLPDGQETTVSTKQLAPPGDRHLQEIPSIEQPLETFENSNFNESIPDTNQNDIEKLWEPKTPSADQIRPHRS